MICLHRLWPKANLRGGAGDPEPGPKSKSAGGCAESYLDLGPAAAGSEPRRQPKTGRPGQLAGRVREPESEGSRGESPRNWRSPRRTTLGLVALGSSRYRRELQDSGGSRGRGTTFPRRPRETGGHRESAPGGTASRYDRAALGGESAAARPRRRPPRGGRARGTWRPGAELMSSSVAGPDCCGGLGNVDFRQVRTGPLGRGSGEGSRGRVGLPASSCRGSQRPVGGAPVARQRGGGTGRGCVLEGVARVCARVTDCVCQRVSS